MLKHRFRTMRICPENKFEAGHQNAAMKKPAERPVFRLRSAGFILHSVFQSFSGRTYCSKKTPLKS